MASWSETTKHEPSSINGGQRYEKGDRVSREQLNSLAENSFYAVSKSDEANTKSQNALAVANNAFEQSKVTGTQVMVGGVFQPTFDADSKLDVDSATAQFAESERQKSLGSSGVIVHEKELNEKINTRTLVYDMNYTDGNAIDIGASTLTTLQEYFDLFSMDVEKTYRCDIGNLSTTNFKNLVGTPDGGGNYTQCAIKLVVKGERNDKKWYRTFELIAIDPYTTCVAKAHIYCNSNDAVVFTGWIK